ncbi:MAG: hemerythrin domain-containing protein [Kiloniellales bacterium]|nr:hemerythrin domain-containing protein [Kiloniellales bacterium]
MDELLRAFREDHALLGRGFHRISSALRAGRQSEASAAAADVDRDAGAHIAFEERHFYPVLVPLIGKDHVEGLLNEHAEGLAVVRALETLPMAAALPEEERRELLRASEAMEAHIAECGELFEAIGRITKAEQATLLDELLKLRAEHPAWTEVSGDRP